MITQTEGNIIPNEEKAKSIYQQLVEDRDINKLIDYKVKLLNTGKIKIELDPQGIGRIIQDTEIEELLKEIDLAISQRQRQIISNAESII